MKTKYFVLHLCKRIMFAVLMTFGIATSTMANEIVIETAVFSDNLNRGSIFPEGSPEVVYEVAITVTAVPIIENNSILKLPNVCNENARSQVIADLAGLSLRMKKQV